MGAVKEMMCGVCVSVTEWGIVVMDVIWHRLWCKYDLRKGECSELGKGATSEAGSISSELLMCGGGMHSILLLPLVARCLEYCDTWSCKYLCMGSMSVFVMQMLYIYVLCASCVSSQCCILHDLQFVNAGRGWKRHIPEPVS